MICFSDNFLAKQSNFRTKILTVPFIYVQRQEQPIGGMVLLLPGGILCVFKGQQVQLTPSSAELSSIRHTCLYP